jgi:RsiW-degrading membrane proteinase PrsW (M82 family)
MFVAMPALAVVAVYILAAILPAIFLMRYIYRMDSAEKEPPGLLLSLVFMGVAAALCSIIFEYLGEGILDANINKNNPAYTVILAFIVVAAVEEGTKFFFLARRTWRDPNFNFRFDGVVYAVFVSLGFAAFENIRYVFGYGLYVSIPRAFLAIPGHMGFAVFMGAFYGRAKLCADMGPPRETHAQSHRGLSHGGAAARLLRHLRDVRQHAVDDSFHLVRGDNVYRRHQKNKARGRDRPAGVKNKKRAAVSGSEACGRS